jgi:hypothetical protein
VVSSKSTVTCTSRCCGLRFRCWASNVTKLRTAGSAGTNDKQDCVRCSCNYACNAERASAGVKQERAKYRTHPRIRARADETRRGRILKQECDLVNRHGGCIIGNLKVRGSYRFFRCAPN